MIDKLRDEAYQLLAETSFCTLATSGPAGIQASSVRCLLQGKQLYLLLPDTSEHLFNMELEPTIVLTTNEWELRGHSEIMAEPPKQIPKNQTRWHVVVTIIPQRMQINLSGLNNYPTTIDFPANYKS